MQTKRFWTKKAWSPQDLPAAVCDLRKAEFRDENTLVRVRMCAHAHTHTSCHGFHASEGLGCSGHRPPWGRWPAAGPSSAYSSKAGQFPDPFSPLKSSRRHLDRPSREASYESQPLRKPDHPSSSWQGDAKGCPSEVNPSLWTVPEVDGRVLFIPAPFLCPVHSLLRSEERGTSSGCLSLGAQALNLQSS